MVPSGTKFIADEKPNQCAAWRKMDWWDVISDQLWNTLGVVKK